MTNVKKLAITLFASMVLLTACTEQKKQPSLVGVITFLKGKIKINDQRAKIADQLKKNDIITSGDNSTAVVQFANKALMIIKSNSRIVLQDLFRDKQAKVNLTWQQAKGSTFHKVIKGQAKYRVNTPTAVAGVRGTAFNVYVTKKRSKISLLHGRVQIKNDKGQELMLETEQSVNVTQKIHEPFKLTETSKAKMVPLDQVPLVKIERKVATEQTTEANKVATNNQKINEALKQPEFKILEKVEIPDKVVKKFMALKQEEEPESLVDIAKKYGKLYIIKTKAGDTYVGALKEKGKKINIITPKGTFTITRKELKSKQDVPQVFKK